MVSVFAWFGCLLLFQAVALWVYALKKSLEAASLVFALFMHLFSRHGQGNWIMYVRRCALKVSYETRFLVDAFLSSLLAVAEQLGTHV